MTAKLARFILGREDSDANADTLARAYLDLTEQLKVAKEAGAQEERGRVDDLIEVAMDIIDNPGIRLTNPDLRARLCDVLAAYATATETTNG